MIFLLLFTRIIPPILVSSSPQSYLTLVLSYSILGAIIAPQNCQFGLVSIHVCFWLDNMNKERRVRKAARKRTVVSAIKLSVLVLLSTFLLTSCGAGSSSLPICQTDDVSEFLNCALGSTGGIEKKSESLSAYCQEDETEWLSALNKSARSSLPEVQIYFQDLLTLGKARPEDLDHGVLYRNVIAIFILEPSQKGAEGSTGSCIDHFVDMRSGGLMTWLRENE